VDPVLDRGDPSGPAEPELTESWRLLMGLVLDQRFRWSEVATELGISQAGSAHCSPSSPTNR